jgi:hypothetical protein
MPGDGEEHRQDQRDDQRQPPLDGEHDPQGAHDGDGGDEQILRPVVSQLRDVEEVGGEAAHELAGAVLIEIAEAQLLHMAEKVPADVGLHQDAEGVAPVADNVIEQRPHAEGRSTAAMTAKKVR